MNRFLLLLVPAALFAGQARYARLGEFDGKVEVQLHAGDPWSPAERNLPLAESAWLRTGASSRLEIELDDGSAWRLGPDSQVEISDYTRLSTGQRLTVLSLDRGVAYFTGEPGGADTLTLVAPGAQVTLLHGARVRLQVDATREPDLRDRRRGPILLPGSRARCQGRADGACGPREHGAFLVGSRSALPGPGPLERRSR